MLKLTLNKPLNSPKLQSFLAAQKALKEKSKKDQMYQDILNVLQKDLPDLFPKDRPKLLEIGIREKLEINYKGKISVSKIRFFLNRYIHSKEYLKCFKLGAKRFDLAGNTTCKIRFADLKNIAIKIPLIKKVLNRLNQKNQPR